jgi:hypothetical protein
MILADTIILKNGTVINGKVKSQDGNQLVVTDKNGSTQKIAKSDMLRVLYKDASDKEVQDIIKEYKAKQKSDAKVGGSKGKGTSGETSEDATDKTRFIRFSGDWSLGYYETDWEKRLISTNLLGGRLESDWSGRFGLGLRLGGEYVKKLENSFMANYFAGLDISCYERNYESNAVGFTFSNRKADANLNLFRLHAGFTWEIQPEIRLKPKFNIFKIQQSLDSSTNDYGLSGTIPVVGKGTDTINTVGITSTLSLLFEYNLQKDFTLFTELHLISPLIYEDKGNYEAKYQSFSATTSPAMSVQIGSSKGGYATSVSGISVGFSKNLTRNMRFFGMYENLELTTKVTGPVGYTASVGVFGTTVVPGVDVVSTTATQIVFYGQEQPIRLQGIKAGVSIDLNLSK